MELNRDVDFRQTADELVKLADAKLRMARVLQRHFAITLGYGYSDIPKDMKEAIDELAEGARQDYTLIGKILARRTMTR